jgi:hypothetical protein
MNITTNHLKQSLLMHKGAACKMSDRPMEISASMSSVQVHFLEINQLSHDVMQHSATLNIVLLQ